MNNRLRVLHVGKYYPPYRGGMESHLQTLCAQLAKAVELRVIVSNDGVRTVRETFGSVGVIRVGRRAQLASTPLCPGMIACIRSTAADIIHLHLPNPMAVVSYMAANPSGKLVVTYHSDVVRQKVLGTLFSLVMRMLLNRCEAVIVASPGYLQSSPMLADFKQRCRVIPFGIETSERPACDPGRVRAIRERFGPNLVLAVGRHVYYKGFQYLIRAMKTAPGTLLMAGDGPLRSRLESEANSAGLAHRVHFLGIVQDVEPYYHAADVFVLPSIARSEAFGLVQLEAMRCATPVINTCIPTGVPFVSLDGETGFTVPPCDSVALAGAIRRLLGDPGLRLRFGLAARQRVHAEFSASVMAERTMALYQSMTRQPGSSHPPGLASVPSILHHFPEDSL